MAFRILNELSARASVMRAKIDKYIQDSLGINDAAQSRLYQIMIDVVQDVFQLSVLFQMNAHRELSKHHATKETSIRALAEFSGHHATRPISSRGVVTMKKVGNLTIGSYLYISPTATMKCLSNGLTYKVNLDVEKRISLSSELIRLPLIQGEVKTQTFVIDGYNNDLNLYVLNLDDSEFIEHYSVKVKVNGELYSRADSLLDMGFGQSEYLLRNGLSNQIDIIFGDKTHGIMLTDGDVVEVEYLLTQGEVGIITKSEKFEILEGFTDSNGNDINEFEVVRESGFQLASNGENKEVTRNLIGYSSRALTFATPNNIKAFLSRLSILSHIDVYSDRNNDLISHILALPKLNFLNSRDYLGVSLDKFKLSSEQKSSIMDMLNNSRRQFPTSEIVFDDPIFKKYSMLVYIDAEIEDEDDVRNDVKDTICDIVLESTFKSVDMQFDNVISNTKILNALYGLDYINKVQVNIFSEDNETAKSNGFYIDKREVLVGNVNQVQDVRVTLNPGDNPNLGLSELNDIEVKSGEIPVLRPIALYNQNNLTQLSDSIIIFFKSRNTWVQL